MTQTVTRAHVQQQLQNREIPRTAFDDAQLPASIRDRARRADLDGNGVISGRREIDAFFSAADSGDRNGSRNSITARTANGELTGPGRAIELGLQHSRAATTPSREPLPTRPGKRLEGAELRQALQHNVRQFREVDEGKLRAALPPQARHLAGDFITAGRNYNVDPLTLVSIARFETGNFTSPAFRNRRNAMGVSNSSGPIHQRSQAESIHNKAFHIADPTGPYRNVHNLGELWRVYAPGPATGQRQVRNDPRNTNRFWGGTVAANIRFYEAVTR